MLRVLVGDEGVEDPELEFRCAPARSKAAWNLCGLRQRLHPVRTLVSASGRPREFLVLLEGTINRTFTRC